MCVCVCTRLVGYTLDTGIAELRLRILLRERVRERTINILKQVVDAASKVIMVRFSMVTITILYDCAQHSLT